MTLTKQSLANVPKKKHRGKRFFGKRETRAEKAFGRRATTIRARRGEDGAWSLVPPRCAIERQLDLEEVQAMLDAGEIDVATDELRWLLSECADFMPAHRLLGELAMEVGDFQLARGHFGYAFEIGRSALPEGKLDGPLPYADERNQPLFEAAKGLAWCLKQLDKPRLGLAVVEEMLNWDTSDPLNVRPWLEAWRSPAKGVAPPSPAHRPRGGQRPERS